MNPIYGFIGRLNSMPALVSPNFSGMQAQLQYALSNPDMKTETEKHMTNIAMAYGACYADDDDYRPYPIYEGVAIIPIHGLLINRCSWSCSWLTGYEFVLSALQDAMDNPRVKAIAFDIASFGGEAQGCFEAAAYIYAMRGQKPMLSILNPNACSAAYALACAADRIVSTPTGMSGSIGVVMMHVDFSKMLKNEGIEVKFIYAGAHKKDGNRFEPLPKEVEADMQASVDRFYEMFASSVATYRGTSIDAIKATEARVYDAPEALNIGLIDAVEAAPAALIAFANELSGSQSQEVSMNTAEQAAAKAKADAEAKAKAEADAQAKTDAEAKAEADAKAQAEAEAKTKAAQATAAGAPDGSAAAAGERARISAIVGSDEAKERGSLANHLAFNTSMSVDDAKKTLAASAKEAGGANPFAAAMGSSDNPEVGAGGESGDGKDAKSDADRIMANFTTATGISPKK